MDGKKAVRVAPLGHYLDCPAYDEVPRVFAPIAFHTTHHGDRSILATR